jgi:GNAT superfamily N-acetyltransferase
MLHVSRYPLVKHTAVQVRLAQSEDAAIVSGLLSAAAANLRERGEELWSAAEVSELAVLPDIRSGLYQLGFDGLEAVGVFRLQLQDLAFWPDIPDGTSAYLHKLAVIPTLQGQGLAHVLLGHAVRLTREKDLRFLRLDCRGGRPKLRAVYESFGFRHHSQKLLGGQVFERFELELGAPNA